MGLALLGRYCLEIPYNVLVSSFSVLVYGHISKKKKKAYTKKKAPKEFQPLLQQLREVLVTVRIEERIYNKNYLRLTNLKMYANNLHNTMIITSWMINLGIGSCTGEVPSNILIVATFQKMILSSSRITPQYQQTNNNNNNSKPATQQPQVGERKRRKYQNKKRAWIFVATTNPHRDELFT